jgi:probable rRNA maturation factor
MRRAAGEIEVAWLPAGPRLLSDEELRRVARAALAHGGRPGLALSLVFVDDPTLARMHAAHLDDPAATDVMAFDLGEAGGGAAGELYVSVDRARAEARRRSLPPDRELALYVVHGCLHLCGLDDHRPRDRARMRTAERRVLGALGLELDPPARGRG